MTGTDLVKYNINAKNDGFVEGAVLAQGIKGHFIEEDQSPDIETKDYELRMEPQIVFFTRVAFLLLALVFQASLVAILFMLMMFLCIMFVQRASGENFNPNSVNVRRILRQGRLMDAMQRIPYSNFMLRQASECPICMESFEKESQVV